MRAVSTVSISTRFKPGIEKRQIYWTLFQAGTKIASGSDDLNIIVWEWERGRYIHTMLSY